MLSSRSHGGADCSASPARVQSRRFGDVQTRTLWPREGVLNPPVRGGGGGGASGAAKCVGEAREGVSEGGQRRVEGRSEEWSEASE
jgi:hypothetical protein